MCGIYEITDREIKFDTGLNEDELLNSKEKFTKDGKFLFTKDWVSVTNHSRYNSFKGIKNEIAIDNERNRIPEPILDTLSIPYVYPTDTTTNTITITNSNIYSENTKIIASIMEVEPTKGLEKYLNVTYKDYVFEKFTDHFVQWCTDKKIKPTIARWMNWVRLAEERGTLKRRAE